MHVLTSGFTDVEFGGKIHRWSFCAPEIFHSDLPDRMRLVVF